MTRTARPDIAASAARSVSPLADHIMAVILGMIIVLPLWAFSHFILGSGGAP